MVWRRFFLLVCLKRSRRATLPCSFLPPSLAPSQPPFLRSPPGRGSFGRCGSRVLPHGMGKSRAREPAGGHQTWAFCPQNPGLALPRGCRSCLDAARGLRGVSGGAPEAPGALSGRSLPLFWEAADLGSAQRAGAGGEVPPLVLAGKIHPGQGSRENLRQVSGICRRCSQEERTCFACFL